MNNNFYCKIVCGDDDFSIDDWNNASQYLETTDLFEDEKTEILFPEVNGTCEVQCSDCIMTVSERQLKTKQMLINSPT